MSNVFPIRCQCGTLNKRLCDLHAVPTVCVCAVPKPNRGGQCRTCLRSYKPEVPGFDACREAWRDRLKENACV